MVEPKPPAPPRRKVSKIGETIIRVREALGLSQQALADLAGISRPTLARIETGATEWIRPDKEEAIARAVGLTVEQMRSGADRQFADPQAAVEEYLKSPYAAIDNPDGPEIQWLRGLPRYVWAGQGKPTPKAVSKILEFHRLGRPSQ